MTVAGALRAMRYDPKNKSKIMTYMILCIALVESAAIYGLIVAFQLVDSESLAGLVGA